MSISHHNNSDGIDLSYLGTLKEAEEETTKDYMAKDSIKGTEDCE